MEHESLVVKVLLEGEGCGLAGGRGGARIELPEGRSRQEHRELLDNLSIC